MSLMVGLAGIAVMVAGLIALLVSLVKKGDKKPPAIALGVGAALFVVGVALVGSEPVQDPHEAEIVAAYEQVAAANDKCTEAYGNYSLIPMLADSPDAAAKSKEKGDALYQEAVSLMAESADAVDAVNGLPSSEYGDVIACMDAYAVEVGARIAALGENAANGEYSTDDTGGVATAYGNLSVAAGKLNVELGDDQDS